MFGVALVILSQLFGEISTSMGRYEVARKKESLYAMGFLSGIWATVFLIIIGVARDQFIFSFASLPTFALRTLLEIALMFVSLHAVVAADRSTFAFLRTLTIPLLLATDIALGYSLTTLQIAGVSLIAMACLFLFANNSLSRGGKLLCILSAILAVGTLTLYKYNITHFNSVEAEQSLLHLILLAVLVIAAHVHTGENLFRYLLSPLFLVQSIAAGISTVFLSFAYLFAPASIITAAKRGAEVLLAVLSGQVLFREKHVAFKLMAFVLLSAGIVCTLL